MRVCKIGHSCVVVEAGGARLLVDPGVFTRTEALANVGPIDAVLYTHGHTDHIDRDRLRLLLAARPDLPLYADRPTGELIDMWDLGVGWTELQGGGEVEIRDVSLRVWEGPHHPIHPRVDAGRNLSLLFDGAFLHPGDALFRPPGVEVKLLAVPFCALRVARGVHRLRARRTTRAACCRCTTATSPNRARTNRSLRACGRPTGYASSGWPPAAWSACDPIAKN